MSTKSKKAHGFILVELLVAMTLFTIIAAAILGGFVSARDGRVSQKQNLLAKGYLDQAVEALRSVRERDWDLVATNGTYYPRLDNNMWVLDTPPLPQGELVDGFRRKIVISDVYRDISPTSPTFGNVVAAGGSLDMASKKAVITVSWGSLARQSISFTQFLTRYSPNDDFEHNLCGDFDGGNAGGTLVVQHENQDECESGDEAEDGEVILAPGGYGNWCNPIGPSITTVDLSRQGVPTTVWAFRTEKDGDRFNEVFAGTGGNASGPTFTNTKIEQIGEDPITKQAILEDTPLGDYEAKKANSVFGDKNYAYLTTDDKSDSMIIIDLNQYTNPPTNSLYEKVGAFDSGEQVRHYSVYVDEDRAYVTTSKLYIIDVSNKSNPTKNSTFSLDGKGTKVVVLNNIAYIGIADSSTKLEVVDVSNPGSPSLLGKLVNSGLASVRDVYVRYDGKRAYMVTDRSPSGNEFFIVDVHIPNSPTLVSGGSHETGMNARGVVVVASDTLAIVVGMDGSDTYPEYQVLDISNESGVTYCTRGGTGKMRVPDGIHAISAVYQEDDGHAFSYIATGDANAELKIVEGGTGGMGGGGGYSGMFESQPITPFTNDVQFNRFDTVMDMQGGEIRLWVASYEPESGSCTLSGSYPYVGPDGTDGTYFGSAGIIPFASSISGYVNPAKCIKYKFQLISAAPGTTPVFESIKVNYSP